MRRLLWLLLLVGSFSIATPGCAFFKEFGTWFTTDPDGPQGPEQSPAAEGGAQFWTNATKYGLPGAGGLFVVYILTRWRADKAKEAKAAEAAKAAAATPAEPEVTQ